MVELPRSGLQQAQESLVRDISGSHSPGHATEVQLAKPHLVIPDHAEKLSLVILTTVVGSRGSEALPRSRYPPSASVGCHPGPDRDDPSVRIQSAVARMTTEPAADPTDLVADPLGNHWTRTLLCTGGPSRALLAAVTRLNPNSPLPSRLVHSAPGRRK